MALIEKCKNGHVRTAKNAGPRKDRSGSYCKECKAAATRRARAKKAGWASGERDWSRTCARPDCGKPFQASGARPGLQYCSPECRRIVTARRRSLKTERSRLPVAPLAEYAERHGLPFEVEGHDGTVGLFEADEYAVKYLGTHPALIFGEAWWEAEAA